MDYNNKMNPFQQSRLALTRILQNFKIDFAPDFQDDIKGVRMVNTFIKSEKPVMVKFTSLSNPLAAVL